MTTINAPGTRMSERSKGNLTAMATLITLALTIGGLIWAASTRNSDLEHLTTAMRDHEERLRKVEGDSEKIARIEEKLDALKATVQRIDRKLP